MLFVIVFQVGCLRSASLVAHHATPAPAWSRRQSVWLLTLLLPRDMSPNPLWMGYTDITHTLLPPFHTSDLSIAKLQVRLIRSSLPQHQLRKRYLTTGRHGALGLRVYYMYLSAISSSKGASDVLTVHFDGTVEDTNCAARTGWENRSC